MARTSFFDTPSRVIGSVALLSALVGIIVFPIVISNQSQPSRRLLQQGNCSWQVFVNTIISVPSTYEFYEIQNGDVFGNLLVMQPPSATLSTGVDSYMNSALQFRVAQFSPPIKQLKPYGWWEYLYPLHTDGVSILTTGIACITSGDCYLNAWNTLFAENSISFGIDTNVGYLLFYISRTDGNNFEFANFTLPVSRQFSVSLINY